jgi:hypothetical protein
VWWHESGFPGIYGVFRFCLLFLLLIISLIRVLRLAAGGEVRESFVSFGVITFRASTFMLSLLWLILKTTKEAAKSFHHTFVRPECVKEIIFGHCMLFEEMEGKVNFISQLLY